jgi:hypothetical protein
MLVISTLILKYLVRIYYIVMFAGTLVPYSIPRVRKRVRWLLPSIGPRGCEQRVVDDLPTSRKWVTESPPDFSRKSGNRDKALLWRFWGSCRLRVGKTGHPHDAPPKRVLRLFRTVLKFIRLKIYCISTRCCRIRGRDPAGS